MNNFKNLNYKQGKLQTSEGKLMIGKLKGNFTRDGIKDELVKISTALKDDGKVGKIGISYHFKTANHYVPAIMSQFGGSALYDITDSDRGQAYINDSIDAVDIYIINNDDETKNTHFRTTKQLGYKDYFGKV